MIKLRSLDLESPEAGLARVGSLGAKGAEDDILNVELALYRVTGEVVVSVQTIIDELLTYR